MLMHATHRSGRNATTARGRGRRAGLVLLALGFVTGCSDPGFVAVQADLRQEPATESKVLAVIPKGSAIKVGDCSNGWCRVSWNGHDGYILTKSMRLTGGVRRNVSDASQPEEQEDDDVNSTVPDIGPQPPSSPD